MLLAELIGEPERKVKKAIAKLEELSGYHSEDIRLLAESRRVLADKIQALGLDPADTTGEELYQAMQIKLRQDMEHVARAWGLGEDASNNLIEILDKNSADEILAIKNTSLKNLLKALPPKKAVKLLGYRSLESMLKRENTAVVLAVAISVESQQWTTRLSSKISQLKTSDYEIRQISFVQISSNKPVAKAINYALAVPLTATVCINPPDGGQLKAAVALLAMEAESLLLADDAYLRSKQFSKDFNKSSQQVFMGYKLQDSLVEEDIFGLSQTGQTDLACDRFSSLHPALSWWNNTAHLAHLENGPTSLNLTDNVMNMLGGNNYANCLMHNFTVSLKKKLAEQYLNYQAVKNYFAPAVDDTFISLENIAAKELVPDFEEIRNL